MGQKDTQCVVGTNFAVPRDDLKITLRVRARFPSEVFGEDFASRQPDQIPNRLNPLGRGQVRDAAMQAQPKLARPDFV
jgi:hypothetical protein